MRSGIREMIPPADEIRDRIGVVKGEKKAEIKRIRLLYNVELRRLANLLKVAESYSLVGKLPESEEVACGASVECVEDSEPESDAS